MEILFIILIILTYITYTIFKNDFLTPSFIGSAMFLLSLLLLVFYSKAWGVDWSYKTSLLITFSLICLIGGDIFGRKIAFRPNNNLIYRILNLLGSRFKLSTPTEFDIGYRINIYKLILINLICILGLVVYARESFQMISGYSGYESTILMKISDLKRSGMHVSSLAAQFLTINNAIALVMGYFVIKSGKEFKRFKFKMFYITPILIYLINTLFTSGRSIILNLLIAYFFIWAILYQRRHGVILKSNFKVIKVVIIIFILIITVFYFSGTISGKSYHYNNIFDNIAIYFSSSLYALNNYVVNPSVFNNKEFFGIHTLSGLFTTLRTLGFEIPSSVVSYEYIPCGYIETNIYTALRRYYQDFGYIGIGFIMFFLGYIYTRILKVNRSNYFSDIITIMSAYISYPIIFLPIEERFFMEVFSITTIYITVYVVLIYRFLLPKRAFARKSMK